MFRRTSTPVFGHLFCIKDFYLFRFVFSWKKFFEAFKNLRSSAKAARSSVDVCRSFVSGCRISRSSIRLPEGREGKDETRGGDTEGRRKTEESIKSRAVLLRVFPTFAGVMCQAYGTMVTAVTPFTMPGHHSPTRIPATRPEITSC